MLKNNILRAQVKQALELLIKAGLVYPITHTGVNGIPLGAERNDKYQKGEKIIPIEVKSGTQGAMQSLREFMKEKHSLLGVRTSLENFSRYEQIDVYPLYAISNLIIDTSASH